MRSVFMITCCLFGLSISTLFRDIFKGLAGSSDGSISNVIKKLPGNVIQDLEGDEQEAGQFVCQVLINHNIPGAIEDLGEDVWNEIKGDWSAVTGFIESLPTLAPAILEDIVQDGEDVVSVVEEIITDPGAIITIIEGGVKTVVSDIESIGGDVTSLFRCLFGCKSTGTTTANPAATLSNSCKSVLAATTTTTHASTSSPHSTYASVSSTHASASPTFSIRSSTSWTYPSHTSTSSATIPRATPVTATSFTSVKNDPSTTAVQSSSNGQQIITPSAQGGTSGGTGLSGLRTPEMRVWAGLMINFIVAVIFL